MCVGGERREEQNRTYINERKENIFKRKIRMEKKELRKEKWNNVDETKSSIARFYIRVNEI